MTIYSVYGVVIDMEHTNNWQIVVANNYFARKTRDMHDAEMGEFVPGIVDELGVLSPEMIELLTARQNELETAWHVAKSEKGKSASHREFSALQDVVNAIRAYVSAVRDGKRMAAKFDGTCALTGAAINTGDAIIYHNKRAFLA